MNILPTQRIDSEFSYMDRLRRPATHRLRIFATETHTTILITDLSHRYVCPSVTNSIEDLMNALLAEHTEIRPDRMVVIEHYDDRERIPRGARGRVPVSGRETFDRVTFVVGRDGRLHKPSWEHLSKASAEELIGSPLP